MLPPTQLEYMPFRRCERVEHWPNDRHRVTRALAKLRQDPFRMRFAANQAPIAGERSRAEQIEDPLQFGAVPPEWSRLEFKRKVMRVLILL